MHMKTTMRCHCTPVRMVIINILTNVMVRMWRKVNLCASLVGKQTGAATMDNNMEGP